jgi:hypothetical protein
MNYRDKETQTYADSGFRTAEDWASLGREVERDSAPRAETLQRGKTLALYTRDQTLAARRRDR